ncbi:hypothetical protein B0H16DRAFT_1888117 [Mycena metata]|uniref:Uncharacterized protein n=1 Tax=Mycena metata TaxID=1033252 RepID=A0AAD7IUN1_9AGAR|nr:hypothetical protein B0H16DRAFT_1888117 [Mycena metata]
MLVTSLPRMCDSPPCVRLPSAPRAELEITAVPRHPRGSGRRCKDTETITADANTYVVCRIDEAVLTGTQYHSRARGEGIAARLHTQRYAAASHFLRPPPYSAALFTANLSGIMLISPARVVRPAYRPVSSQRAAVARARYCCSLTTSAPPISPYRPPQLPTASTHAPYDQHPGYHTHQLSLLPSSSLIALATSFLPCTPPLYPVVLSIIPTTVRVKGAEGGDGPSLLLTSSSRRRNTDAGRDEEDTDDSKCVLLPHSSLPSPPCAQPDTRLVANPTVLHRVASGGGQTSDTDTDVEKCDQPFISRER